MKKKAKKKQKNKQKNNNNKNTQQQQNSILWRPIWVYIVCLVISVRIFRSIRTLSESLNPLLKILDPPISGVYIISFVTVTKWFPIILFICTETFKNNFSIQNYLLIVVDIPLVS